MYRYARFGGTKPSTSGIITHAQDDSSRIEIDNKVFINANINPDETGTTRNFYAHRHNDSMSFSWNPMQVINLSRQEKAVCTREQNKLTSLERHFTRQSHLEHFKQSTIINKFRQRLARLNQLRECPDVKSYTDNYRGFPINAPTIRSRESVTSSDNIAQLSNASINRNGVNKPAVHSDRFFRTIKIGQTATNKSRCLYDQAGHNRRYLGYKRSDQTSDKPTGVLHGRAYRGLNTLCGEGKISARQIRDQSPYEGYPCSDKHRTLSNELGKFTLREVKSNGNNKSRLDLYKSDLINAGENKTESRQRSPIRIDCGVTGEGKPIKSVRFHNEPVEPRQVTKLGPGEFKKLVQLSHFERQSKRK